ncbi:MAG TPA: VOC family protein [Candidatus Acidoferrales bacterium]|nr:VOC family protein [Candidatus Acidoferrales bacterium]
MPSTVKPVPEGYHTATPYLTVHDAAKAIDFYKQAFGASEIMRMQGPNGKIGHAELRIGDSVVMLADEMPGSDMKSPQSLGGSCAGVFLYVTDVDTTYNKAVAAGAKSTMPLADQFWGDRFGKLTDPFGHSWALATHKENVAPDEMKRRAEAQMAKMTATRKSGAS